MSATQGSGYVFSQQVYDTICTVYHDFVLPHNEHAQNVLDRLSYHGHLKPHSRVLEVGCGPGKPITAFFSNNGHNVTAIDASSGMLDIARKNAPYAKFLQADMTSWEPSESGIETPCYDVIVASHCLYSMSVSQVRSLFYKFTRWVKKDGIVVIGMSYNQGNLRRNNRELDERGWAEGITINFLGYQFEDSSCGRADAWVDLIKSTGLEIVDVDSSMLYRADESDPDVQFYITAKRVQENSFFGPFPIPNTIGGGIPSKFRGDVDAWVELRGKLDTVKLKEAILDALIQKPKCNSVLSVAGQITPGKFFFLIYSNPSSYSTFCHTQLSKNQALEYSKYQNYLLLTFNSPLLTVFYSAMAFSVLLLHLKIISIMQYRQSHRPVLLKSSLSNVPPITN